LSRLPDESALSYDWTASEAFRTATGVDAAAIRKARLQTNWLSDRVYAYARSADHVLGDEEVARLVGDRGDL
jgi:hypothetical protein